MKHIKNLLALTAALQLAGRLTRATTMVWLNHKTNGELGDTIATNRKQRARMGARHARRCAEVVEQHGLDMFADIYRKTANKLTERALKEAQ